MSLLCFCYLVLMFYGRFGSDVVPFVYDGSCLKELAFHGVVGIAYNLFDDMSFRDMGSWNAQKVLGFIIRHRLHCLCYKIWYLTSLLNGLHNLLSNE